MYFPILHLRPNLQNILQSHPEVIELLKEYSDSQMHSANAVVTLLSVTLPPMLHFLFAYYSQYALQSTHE
jgi:hypothetical protein